MCAPSILSPSAVPGMPAISELLPTRQCLPAPDYINGSQFQQETEGWGESWAALQSFMLRHGPFDGVLGFSQVWMVPDGKAKLSLDVKKMQGLLLLMSLLSSIHVCCMLAQQTACHSVTIDAWSLLVALSSVFCEGCVWSQSLYQCMFADPSNQMMTK